MKSATKGLAGDEDHRAVFADGARERESVVSAVARAGGTRRRKVCMRVAPKVVI
jgi:hypothetical protein